MLYTNVEEDKSISQHRYMGEGKAAFKHCAAFYDLSKEGEEPWRCGRMEGHDCRTYRQSAASTETEEPKGSVESADGIEPVDGGNDAGEAEPKESTEVTVPEDPEPVHHEAAVEVEEEEEEAVLPVPSRKLRPRVALAAAVEVPFKRLRSELADTRPRIEIVELPPEVQTRFLEVVRPRLVSYPDWVPITGGSHQRWYIPNLHDGRVIHKALEELLNAETKWVRDWIQAKYSALKYYKLGAIRSDSGAASQFAGHRGRLHSDYHDSCNKRTPAERPVSFMVALDRFQLIHSSSRGDRSEPLVTRWIETGDMVLFGNHLMHSGGANPEEKPVYRVFGYFVSDPADFPGTYVFF